MNKNTRFIVEAGIMLALAFVLSQFKLFKMPLGGSVTAGSMIPLLFIAFRWGLLRGILACTVYGFLQMIFGGSVIGMIQGALDYPIAFGSIGFAGVAAGALKQNKNPKGLITAAISATGALLMRYTAHVISGVVFFSEYAGDKNPLIHSLEYNSFIFAELAIAIALLSIIWGPITKRIPSPEK